MSLSELGWTEDRASEFGSYAQRGLGPARVCRQDRAGWLVWTADGIRPAVVAGRMWHEQEIGGHNDGPRGGHNRDAAGSPAVGDWVAVQPGEPAVIHAVLPRTSACVRKSAGAVTAAQVVAANVDWLLLVSGLDGDFNVRRVERYLTFAYHSGASPVIVLNKADLCDDLPQHLAWIEDVAIGVPVHAVCATALGEDHALRAYLQRGKTLAMVGSSGVGKSTLINALLGGDVQRTAAVRSDDDRGRHTTTHRELFVLPGGGVLIDTPGMRELQLWADESSLDAAFADVDALAAECRFSDCRHEHEPGCAVVAAVASGDLPPERLASYHKLQRELRHLERRQDHRARLEEVRRWKVIHKQMRRRPIKRSRRQ